MKKNQKNILIVSFSILIILICLLYLLSNEDKKDSNLLKKVSPVEVLITPPTQIEFKPLSGEIRKEKKVTLNVLDQKYAVSINEGDSVYLAMENLQKNKKNNFSFEYKEYPSLGIFVDKINEKSGGDGKYWIYFINDVEASIGVSQYILKEGDIIKWELK